MFEEKNMTSDKMNMHGEVEIYIINNKTKERKLHCNSHNLIVYSGREWVLSRILNINNTNILPNSADYISWLSVGTGGAPVSDPLSPIPPTNMDSSLANEVPIIAGAVNLADNGNKIGFSDVSFLQDNLNMNRYLITRLSVLFDETMLNGYNINEAGLWISNSNQPTLANVYYLFARYTFPSISKSPDIQFEIIWYLYS